MKKIGFILEVDGAKATFEELAKLELQLDKVNRELKEAKASGNADVYKELRAQQLELQETTKDLRKNIRDQFKEFREVQAPVDSIKGLEDRYKALKKEIDTLSTADPKFDEKTKEAALLSNKIKELRGQIKNQARELSEQAFPEDSIIGLRNRYRQLKKELEGLSTADPEFGEKAKEAARLSDQINEANKSIGNFTSNIGRYEESFTRAIDATSAGFAGSLSGLAAGLGAGGAIVAGLDALQQGLDVVRELTQEAVVLRGEIQQLTGATGVELDSFSAEVIAIADTFNKDFNEVIISANNLSKQFGIDFGEALAAIEQGLLAGADANGDFLDKVREYPVQIKNAGGSLEDFIKIATQEVQGGFFNDTLFIRLYQRDRPFSKGVHKDTKRGFTAARRRLC